MEGKTVLITGGAGGIGAAMAVALAEVGASLVLADVDSAMLDKTADQARAAGAQVLPLVCDVLSKADVEAAFAAATERFGKLHVLINNYGTTQRKLFIDMTEAEWAVEIDRNLTHVFRCTQLAARKMIADEVTGSIINLTTIECYRAAPGYAPYAAAKAGVANFTQTMAMELAPWGIRVNSIAPDATITGGTNRIGGTSEAEKMKDGWAHIARNRRGRPEDYGGAAVFLASDMSEWITGEVIHIGGGTRAASGWRRDEEGYWNNGGPAQIFSGRKLRESRGAT